MASHPTPLPGIATAFRSALFDFYYNSWRLAPANLVWGGLFLVVLVAATTWLPFAALAAGLAVPVAGLHRLAARIIRGESVSFGDFAAGMRRLFVTALATGLVTLGLGAVFLTNVLVGLETGGVLGWTLSALALYGIIGLAMGLVAWWPILADPQREMRPIRERLKLAAVVVLARPGRIFVLTVIITIVLAVSTILAALVIMVSVAYVSLVASRYILPVADRLEAHLAQRRPA